MIVVAYLRRFTDLARFIMHYLVTVLALSSLCAVQTSLAREDDIAYYNTRPCAVDFSDDGTLLATIGSVGATFPFSTFFGIWEWSNSGNTANETRLKISIPTGIIFGHDNWTNSNHCAVAFSPDNTLIAAAHPRWSTHRGLTLALFDVKTGDTVWTFRRSPNLKSVREIDFSPDGMLPAVQGQVFPIGKPIVPLELPEFSGGVLPITYNLQPTTMPVGLFYDVPTRTILGIPTEVSSMDYTYTATDARGQTSTIGFKISIAALTDDPLTALESLAVEPENRCTEYDRDDYSYSQSIEPRIVVKQGGMFSPYDGTCFNALQNSDIEHIVATSEAHDSGMCSQSEDKQTEYASDLLNLTLATPTLNRHEKGAKDFAQWQPPQNGCWYAARIIEVKKKYGLSVDQAEYDSLNAALNRCSDVGFEMEIPNCGTRVSTETEPVFDNPSLHVYPNPVFHTIWFTAEGDIRLFDLLGREVLNQHGFMVDVSHLPAGVYLYRLTADAHEGRHVRTGRFVKVR